MKKYFMIGLGIVLALSLTIILYGAWLNERGEFQIAKRMSERSLELLGSRAAVRFIRPKFTLSTINFYSKDMADAVALSDGRIVSCLTPKSSFVRKGDTLFVIENEELPLQIQQALVIRAMLIMIGAFIIRLTMEAVKRDFGGHFRGRSGTIF